MEIKRIIELLLLERECVERADGRGRDCAKCDLVQNTDELLEMYDKTVAILEEHEPRILTIDEIINGGNRLMWLEYKAVIGMVCGSVLVPDSPYDDNRKEAFSISFQSGLIQSKGLYGKQWRCWTSYPTEEQRKAVKWG